MNVQSAVPQSKPTICFSHANGFPAGTYRVLFEAWQDAGWQVIALPRLGHDPRFPVSLNWPQLWRELAQFIEAQVPGQKVQLVGHSLGGFVSLMLACRRPDLALQVVMLDSPLVGGWRSHSVTMARSLGLFQRWSPGRISEKRRFQWPDAGAAYQHYVSKAAFARWDERVLRDYIACGTEPDTTVGADEGAGEGAAERNAVRLAFTREVETQIYDTLPARLGSFLAKHPPPEKVHFIAGTRSAELRQAGIAATRKLVRERFHWIDGTHLFPMEKPLETAALVLHCLGPANG